MLWMVGKPKIIIMIPILACSVILVVVPPVDYQKTVSSQPIFMYRLCDRLEEVVCYGFLARVHHR